LSLSPSDELHKPYDSYFTDYAKQARILVGGRHIDEGLRILEGYPTEKVLEVKPEGKDNRASLVMDLGKMVPVSRLRIVWRDPSSVPTSCKIDFSEDGKVWQDWLQVKNTVVDAYDQWPGFEYYAPGERTARYVRYSPLGDDAAKPIKLRQLSLFR
jgi:hypothetical protein